MVHSLVVTLALALALLITAPGFGAPGDPQQFNPCNPKIQKCA